MKLLILSDSHDRVDTLDSIAAWGKTQHMEGVIHCGDVASRDTLAHMMDVFGVPVWLCLGNADNFGPSDVTGPTIFLTVGTWEEEGCRIAFVHYPDMAAKLAESQQYDFVFYGHTHKPWLEHIGKTYLANPGNVAGTRYSASFATLDTKTKHIELIPFFRVNQNKV